MSVKGIGASTPNVANATGILATANGGNGVATAGGVSSSISATSGSTGTTLTNIPGLSVALPAAGTYAFEAYLTGTSTVNCGVKFAAAYSGTTTSCSVTGEQNNTTTRNGHSTVTTIGNAVAGANTVFTDGWLEGVIVVSTTGNLTIQFAQNTSHADTTTVNANGFMYVVRIA